MGGVPTEEAEARAHRAFDEILTGLTATPATRPNGKER